MADTIPQAEKSIETKAAGELKKVVAVVKDDAAIVAAKVKSDIEAELSKVDAVTLAEAKALLKDAHDIIERLLADGHQGVAGFLNRLKEFFAKI